MMTLNSLLVEPLDDGDKSERSDRKESDPSKFEELHDDKQGHRLSSEEGVSSPDDSEDIEDDDGEEASSEGEIWMDSSERARLAYYEGRYEDGVADPGYYGTLCRAILGEGEE